MICHGRPCQGQIPPPLKKKIYIYKNLHHNKVVIVVVNMEMSSVNQTFRNHCCGAVSRCTHSAAASGGSKNQGAEENKNGKCLANLRESKKNEKKNIYVHTCIIYRDVSL